MIRTGAGQPLHAHVHDGELTAFRGKVPGLFGFAGARRVDLVRLDDAARGDVEDPRHDNRHEEAGDGEQNDALQSPIGGIESG